jgi:hypothetical protein
MVCRMWRFAVVGLFAALTGCQQCKSYMRDPIVRQHNVIAGPVSEPANATQAEPYPPVRPVLPDDPSNVAVTPMEKTPERTPAK